MKQTLCRLPVQCRCGLIGLRVTVPGIATTGLAGQPDGTTYETFIVPTGATRLFLGIGDRAANLSTASGSYVVSVSPDVPTAPEVSSASIVNGAGFGPAPLAAGSIASIFGANFSPLAAADSVPLPTTLGDTTVYMNAIPAPLFFVSPGQINAQIPPQLRLEREVLVTVVRGGVAGSAAKLSLSPYAPGIFAAAGAGPVVVNNRTGNLVTSAEPAHPGDILIIYATGLGPVLQDVPAGSPAGFDRLSPALLPMEAVLIGQGREVSAVPQFAGLVPGLVGVAQVNLQLPAETPTGTVRLRLQSGSLGGSNTVEIDVR